MRVKTALILFFLLKMPTMLTMATKNLISTNLWLKSGRFIWHIIMKLNYKNF